MTDPLAEALLGQKEAPTNRTTLKMLVLFGDRPEVLEACKTLRQRGWSAQSISKAINQQIAPDRVSLSSVYRWLQYEGLA